MAALVLGHMNPDTDSIISAIALLTCTASVALKSPPPPRVLLPLRPNSC